MRSTVLFCTRDIDVEFGDPLRLSAFLATDEAEQRGRPIDVAAEEEVLGQ